MVTYSNNFLNQIRTVRAFELGVYGMLAASLIGHVFFLNGQVSLNDVALLTIGIVFGLMVSVGGTPLTETHKTAEASQRAEVVSWQGRKQADTSTHDDTRHAA